MIGLYVVNDYLKPARLFEAQARIFEMFDQDLTDYRVTVIDQTEGKLPVPLKYDELYAPKQEWIDGRPVWNLIDALYEMTEQDDVEWQVVFHKEHLPSPGYFESLRHTLSVTKRNVVLCNLRRIGPKVEKRINSNRHNSERLIDAILQGRDVERVFRETPSVPWQQWYNPQRHAVRSRKGGWYEDVFAVRTSWLLELGLYDYRKSMVYTDVYDLMKATWNHLKFKCSVLSQDYYLLHPFHRRNYPELHPPVRDWAKGQSVFKGSSLAAGVNNLFKLRRAPGGIVWNWTQDMKRRGWRRAD